MRSIRGSGCKELSLSSCLGVWNKPPRKKKIANPQGHAQGAWLHAGQIETDMHKECAKIERKYFYSSACWPRSLRSIICWLVEFVYDQSGGFFIINSFS